MLFAAFYLLSTVVALLAGVSGAAVDEEGGVLVFAIATIGSFALLVLMPAAWEIGLRGRSPGKAALGLRVVTIEGAPIRFRHAVVRGLLGIVEILLTFGILAVVVALASKRFRRLGDHLAGTVVIRERGGARTGAVPRWFAPFPGWEPWTATLDATRLSADDYRLVRSFLLRSASLPAEARVELGTRILDRVLPRAGIDASAVPALAAYGVEPPLVAVAAAYQRRFDGVFQ